MRIRHLTALASALPLLLLLYGTAGAQINQRELAVQLRGDEEARHLAFAKVQQLEVARITPELRTELISALEREGQSARRHVDRQRRGEPSYSMYPELQAQMALLVIKFEDPRSVPGLVEALTSSPPATHALARFGEPAALAVLARLRGETYGSMIMGGLMSLRFMAEGVGRAPLTAATRQKMIELARNYLTDGERSVVTLWRALDLAVALGSPELLKTVELFANEPQTTRSRGVVDADLIERTRQHAADRLAGIPPLPHWKDWTK